MTGSLMPNMVQKLIFSIIPSRAPFLVRPLVSSICGGITTNFVNPEIKSKIKYIDAELAKKSGEFKWFAGGDKDGNPVSGMWMYIPVVIKNTFLPGPLPSRFYAQTAADYQMLFPLEAAVAGRVSDLPPSIKAWVDKVHERPAYKRALEKGGKYSYA
jgi:glutathione S-transferase